MSYEADIKLLNNTAEEIAESVGLEISPVWVLSTAHLRRSTADALKGGRHKGVVYDEIEYGFLVWCRSEKQESIPFDELRDLVIMADRMGVRWIKFDCDVDIIEALPHWNWDEEENDDEHGL